MKNLQKPAEAAKWVLFGIKYEPEEFISSKIE